MVLPNSVSGSNPPVDEGQRPLSAQLCHCRTLWRRSPFYPICRPSLSCVADWRFVEFTTYALARCLRQAAPSLPREPTLPTPAPPSGGALDPLRALEPASRSASTCSRNGKYPFRIDEQLLSTGKPFGRRHRRAPVALIATTTATTVPNCPRACFKCY
jgi:hypothetical protein